MVCRNQELFTNNCNHGNERLFHINVCDANRKTVENIATRQSKLCEFVIKLIYLRTSCRLFRCRWIRYRWILCHWRWFRCHLFVVAVNQYLSTYFQCQTNILKQKIPGMESPQCHFQNWGSPTRVEWKGLLSKFLVFSQNLYYSKICHMLDL